MLYNTESGLTMVATPKNFKLLNKNKTVLDAKVFLGLTKHYFVKIYATKNPQLTVSVFIKLRAFQRK